MFKKLLAIFLVLALALCLIACDNGNTNDNGGNTDGGNTDGGNTDNNGGNTNNGGGDAGGDNEIPLPPISDDPVEGPIVPWPLD